MSPPPLANASPLVANIIQSIAARNASSANTAQTGKDPQRNRIVLIDGMNGFLRNFMVNDSVTTSGDPCGGVVGFLRFLGNYVETWAPDQVIVVWEQGGGSPRRKKLFPEYKANRTRISEARDIDTTLGKDKGSLPSKKWVKDDKENKLTQLLLLTEILKFLPVCQVYVSDCECDDVIGYLVREYYSQHRDLVETVTVVSTDKDFYQLLTYPEVRIWEPMRKKLIDAQYVIDTFGISPENFVLGKAVVGDPSDNIPGVYGIGWKTVQQRFGDLLLTRKILGVSDVVDSARSRLREPGLSGKGKGSKGGSVKVFDKVIADQSLIERNVRLMELESSLTLAHTQIAKVKYQVENYVPTLDKLGLIKRMLGSGIVTSIDYDRLHLAWKTLFLRTKQYNGDVAQRLRPPTAKTVTT